MDHGIRPGKCDGEGLGPSDVAPADLHTRSPAGGQATGDLAGTVVVPDQGEDVMAASSPRAGTTWLPTKPLAPVTRMVDIGQGSGRKCANCR